MITMFKIGDFAKLSRVTVRTLRYYEEVGLLKPVQVDKWTGYRYYAPDQLPRLNRILALKDLGFTLEQITEMLKEDLPASELRGMLKMKQAELSQQVREVQERLARVEVRLSQIEQENIMPDYDVVLKKVDAQRVAAAHGIVPNMDVIGPTFDRLFDNAIEHVTRHNGGITGPPVAIYYEVDEQMQDMKVAAAVPTNGDLPDNGNVLMETLPAAEMASAVHRGPFANLNQAYGALFNWIESNGYRIDGPSREVYLQYERGGDQSQYVTEVQFPVAKG
jgi:DNA-binding transcriptional MerR regulator